MTQETLNIFLLIKHIQKYPLNGKMFHFTSQLAFIHLLIKIDFNKWTLSELDECCAKFPFNLFIFLKNLLKS